MLHRRLKAIVIGPTPTIEAPGRPIGISSPKRLRKVASTIEDFGYRRQFSVFLCRLTALELVRLKSRLYDIIYLDADQVIFVPLCARCSERIEALGRSTEPPDARDVVLVS